MKADDAKKIFGFMQSTLYLYKRKLNKIKRELKED
jgi:hypothetical protein